MCQPEHHYAFDEFRELVAPLICGDLFFDYGYYQDHNITEPSIFLLQVKRPQVRYTAITLQHEVVMYSPGYRPALPDRSLAIIAIDGNPIRYNGIEMEPSHIGLASSHVSAPFSVLIPAHTRVLLAEIDNLSQQLQDFSSAMVPLRVNAEYMRRLRQAVEVACEWPAAYTHADTAVPPLGGTESLFKIITELQQQIPPLRLQSLKGRSRLSRKHFIPKIVKLMERNSPRPGTLAEIADELGISTKTINLWFKHYIGIPPKRFYLLLRLFLFRRALLAATTTSVMQATADSGIESWSRYAERYERLFGEKPSETYRQKQNKRVKPTANDNKAQKSL